MITMSKPISASQAREYHKEEFANARDNYYTEATMCAVSGRASSPSVTDCMAKWARTVRAVE